jgi:tetratricopeptide (TPR) repeat protein
VFSSAAKTVCIVVFAVFASSLAQTGTLKEAQNLFARGEFQRAHDIAVRLNTAEGLALAARALSLIDVPRDQRDDVFARCEQYARKAIAFNPRYANGYFELGAAVGQLGAIRGTGWAFVNGVAIQVKENFEKAISLDPKLILARVALGRWHAEIVTRGVGFLFGGSLEEAVRQFEESIRIDPKSILARLEYARTLLVIDQTKNRAAARAQLEIAVKIVPDDYLETRQLEAARKMLESLQ